MGHPAGLYYLFALAMLLVAAYNLSLLVLSIRPDDPAGRDVDIAHVFMGVAMAGMFVTDWAFWPNWFWVASFFILMVWFVTRTALSIQRFGLHVPHEGIHALMAFAMLLMYWYPVSAANGAMSMAMSSSHAMLDPGIGLLVVFLLLGSAIFTLASPNKGASHHGTHRVHQRPVAYESGPDGHDGEGATRVVVAEAPPTGLAVVLQKPQLEDLSHVIMCVGMAFMLVLML
jgi:hypothetical protein